MALDEQTRSRITQILAENEVVLFMKGTRRMPRCGFSATVVQILDSNGIEYRDVDVLADPALREGIKEFGSWPTIPQLYYRGSLIGGCDIVRELDATGELLPSLGRAPVEVRAPTVHLSAAAAAAMREALRDAGPEQTVRVQVLQGGHSHDLSLDAPQPGDFAVEVHGLKLLFDRASARLADGLRIEFVEGPDGGGFRIDNPNAPPQVRQLSARELKARLDAGEPLRLYDVRTPQERTIAVLPGAIHLDERAMAELETLPKDTPLVFHCHHGMRSQAAAEHFVRKGFRNVWNLKGGIDAWSVEVDPSVRRY